MILRQHIRQRADAGLHDEPLPASSMNIVRPMFGLVGSASSAGGLQQAAALSSKAWWVPQTPQSQKIAKLRQTMMGFTAAPSRLRGRTLEMALQNATALNSLPSYAAVFRGPGLFGSYLKYIHGNITNGFNDAVGVFPSRVNSAEIIPTESFEI